MLKDLENKARESLSFKRSQYQGPPNWRVHSFRIERNIGTCEILMQRSIYLTGGGNLELKNFLLIRQTCSILIIELQRCHCVKSVIRNTLKIVVREETIMFVGE